MTTDTPAAAPTAEREAFEHWLWFSGERVITEDYADPRTAAAWDAWQARAALSAPVAAQPADSAMTAEQIEALAHREAWRYVHGSSNPKNCANSLYTFNRATLLEFARALVAKETPHAR